MPYQLVYQGLIERKSQHRKIWHVRGIIVYLNEQDLFSIEIVKQITTEQFLVKDILDIYVYPQDGFIICINIHLENRVLTFGVKFTEQLETFFAIVSAIYFQKLDEETLQMFFKLSIDSLVDDNQYFAYHTNCIPKIKFDNIITKSILVQTTVQLLYSQYISLKYDNKAYLTVLNLFQAIFLQFKLIFQIILYAFTQKDTNPALQLLIQQDVDLLQVKEIIICQENSLLSIDKHTAHYNIFINAVYLPNVVLQVSQSYKFQNIIDYILENNNQMLTISLNKEDIVNWFLFNKKISVKNCMLIQSLRQTLISSYIFDTNKDYLFEENVINPLIQKIRSQFNFQYFHIHIVDNSVYSDILFGLFFLPESSPHVQLHYDSHIYKNRFIVGFNDTKFIIADQEIISIIAEQIKDLFEDSKIFIEFTDKLDDYNLTFNYNLQEQQQSYQIYIQINLENQLTLQVMATQCKQSTGNLITTNFTEESIMTAQNTFINNTSISDYQRISMSQQNIMKQIDSRLSIFKRISYPCMTYIMQESSIFKTFLIQRLEIILKTSIFQRKQNMCLSIINENLYKYLYKTKYFGCKIQTSLKEIRLTFGSQFIIIDVSNYITLFVDIVRSNKLLNFLIQFQRFKAKNIKIQLYNNYLYRELDQLIILGYFKFDESSQKIKLIQGLFDLL